MMSNKHTAGRRSYDSHPDTREHADIYVWADKRKFNSLCQNRIRLIEQWTLLYTDESVFQTAVPPTDNYSDFSEEAVEECLEFQLVAPTKKLQ